MNKEVAFENCQAFSRIVEMMSLMDRVKELAPEEVLAAVNDICRMPDNSLHCMGMEEVVFWAGVATGMEVCRNFEEGWLDAETAEKFMTYSSLFAYSTQSAVVDLALQKLEPGN
jgi:hypothetical protein